MIRFGNGGGFTGATITYSLLSNGQLTKSDGGENTSLKTVDSKTVKELFEKAKELITYSYNDPDNMYSFMEIQSSEKKQYMVWNLGSKNIDTRVTQLYYRLISLTKSISKP